jgi:hypothetical protein
VAAQLFQADRSFYAVNQNLLKRQLLPSPPLKEGVSLLPIDQSRNADHEPEVFDCAGAAILPEL